MSNTSGTNSLDSVRATLRQHPSDAAALTLLAHAHLDRGDDDEALRLARQAVYSDPDYNAAYGLLVEIHEQRGQAAQVAQVHRAWAVAAFKKQQS